MSISSTSYDTDTDSSQTESEIQEVHKKDWKYKKEKKPKTKVNHAVKQSESEMSGDEQSGSDGNVKCRAVPRKKKRLNVAKWKVLRRKKNTVFLYQSGRQLWTLFSK